MATTSGPSVMGISSEYDARIGDERRTLTQPFWDASALGRLVRPVCKVCHHNFFTPSLACPVCLSEDWSYERSDGLGRVYSHTTIHRGPDQSWSVPYVLAIVDLQEGWSMLSRLLVAPPDDLTPGSLIGLPVKVIFVPEDRPPYRSLPAYVPLEAGV